MYDDNIAKEFREFFNDQTKKYISYAMTRAYRHLTELYHSEEFLNNIIGEDVKPYLRKVIVDHYLKQLSKYDSHIRISNELNEGHNCWHVQLRKGKFILTHNFVHNPYDHPRDSEFRKNLQFKNIQLSFKYDEEENVLSIEKDVGEEMDKDIYVQLIHGGEGIIPNFIILNIPNHDGTAWLDRLEIPIVSFPDIPIEEIPDKATPSFKKQEKTSDELDEK